MPPFRNEVVPPDLSRYLPLAGGTMSGSILVDTDDAYNLGSSVKAWQGVYTVDLHVGESIVYGGDLVFRASGAPTAGPSTGFAVTMSGGSGRTASGGAAGTGGAFTMRAGQGGTGDGGHAGGTGGDVDLDAGQGGLDGGAGAGVGGAFRVGTAYATSITIGRAGVTTKIDGTLRYDNIIRTVGGDGGASPPPSRPDQYLVVNIAGVTLQVPAYKPM